MLLATLLVWFLISFTSTFLDPYHIFSQNFQSNSKARSRLGFVIWGRNYFKTRFLIVCPLCVYNNNGWRWSIILYNDLQRMLFFLLCDGERIKFYKTDEMFCLQLSSWEEFTISLSFFVSLIRKISRCGGNIYRKLIHIKNFFLFRWISVPIRTRKYFFINILGKIFEENE